MQFVGPIVGEVTETSARVVVQPDRLGQVTVVLSSAAGAALSASALATADKPVVGVLVSGLSPATVYALSVLLDGIPVPGRVGRVVTRTPGIEQLTVAAVSCNFTVRQGESRLWSQLLTEQVQPGNVSTVLHIGDQVYADTAFGQSMHDAKSGRTQAVFDAIAARFRRLYEYTWNYEATRQVLATTSNLMIWDDHEVRNGWGSHGADRDPTSNEAWVGGIARRVFQDFQRQLWTAPDLNADHEAHAHVYGGVGIVFLDQRGCRTFDYDPTLPYLGAKQWAWLRGTLASAAFASVKALVVITSVPLLYVGEAVAAAAGLVASDLRDQWSYPGHRAEQLQLVDLLVQWKAGAAGREVSVVGGDVHVGGQTVLEAVGPHGAWQPAFRQFITSPITNSPPGALAFFGIKSVLLGSTHDLDARFRYRHESLTPRRNYAVLTLRGPNVGAASIAGSLTEDAQD